MSADPPATSEPDLDDLLGTCLDHLERGDSAAVAALLAEHPACADDLARRLALLSDTGLLPAAEAAEHPPEQLGPFRLRGRLGAGAMGVVWRAWQEPPGREVALKVLRPESLLFQESRARFRREVELAARLSHPSILPILAVGEDGGLPWFATELVAGCSLAELVKLAAERWGTPERVPMDGLARAVAEAARRPPSTWRTAGGEAHADWTRFALHVARDLARALGHAHSRGVLHRDVKPQNALIGADGRVWLADFGLASAPDDASLTGSRSTVGSLPYMAPELLMGAAPDVRADVYGLGALLYELLLLRRPFAQTQSGALVAAILEGASTKPRSIDPSLPRDAEAVLERALAREPGERYPTADALADDLDALLGGRPTAARPRSALTRVALAARRRPGTAAAVVLAFVLVVGGPLAFGLQARAASRAVTKERDRTVAVERERALAAEQAAATIAVERDRARAAFERAMEAVERMLSRLGGDLAYVPAMEALRLRIFEDAIELLERVVADAGDALHGDDRLELARAMQRVGTLRQLLGRQPAGAEAMGEGRAWAASVVDGEQDAELRARALAIESELAIDQVRCLMDTGDLHGGAEHGKAALARLEQHGGVLDTAQRVRLTSSLDVVVGAALSRQGDAAGLARMRSAAESLDALLEAGPPTHKLVDYAFLAWHNTSHEGLRAAGDVPPEQHVVASLARALALAELRVELAPEPVRERDLVSARINLGGAHLRRGEFETAESIYLVARDDAERLVEDHPSTLTFRLEYANALNQLGLIEDERRDFEASAAFYEEVREVMSELCRLAPDSPSLHHKHALAHLNVSHAFRELGDVPEAKARVEAARVELERAMALAPDESEYRTTLLTIHGARWLLCRDLGDHEGVVRVARELAALDVPNPHHRAALHRAAFAHAEAFELAAKDERLSEEERAAVLDQYAEAACDFTQRSFDAGNRYPDVRALRNLTPLHGHARFETYADAFAAARAAEPPPQDG